MSIRIGEVTLVSDSGTARSYHFQDAGQDANVLLSAGADQVVSGDLVFNTKSQGLAVFDSDKKLTSIEIQPGRFVVGRRSSDQDGAFSGVAIQGTANQVTVTHPEGSQTMTLAAPQDLAPSSAPTFHSATITGGLNIANSRIISQNPTPTVCNIPPASTDQTNFVMTDGLTQNIKAETNISNIGYLASGSMVGIGLRGYQEGTTLNCTNLNYLFTRDMEGGVVVYANGTKTMISLYISPQQLRCVTSQNVNDQSFTIYRSGLQCLAGNVSLSSLWMPDVQTTTILQTDTNKQVIGGFVSLSSQVSGVLRSINGGTGSSTVLHGNRYMVSTVDGKIVEGAALPAPNASNIATHLKSETANIALTGIPQPGKILMATTDKTAAWLYPQINSAWTISGKGKNIAAAGFAHNGGADVTLQPPSTLIFEPGYYHVAAKVRAGKITIVYNDIAEEGVAETEVEKVFASNKQERMQINIDGDDPLVPHFVIIKTI